MHTFFNTFFILQRGKGAGERATLSAQASPRRHPPPASMSLLNTARALSYAPPPPPSVAKAGESPAVARASINEYSHSGKSSRNDLSLCEPSISYLLRKRQETAEQGAGGNYRR